MSAYDFPNSPSNGDTVNVAGIVYTYNSTDNAWRTGGGQSPAILSNGTTPSLASGITAAEIRTLIDASADPVDLSSVAQNIIPDADSTRDLGTSSKKFRDLYLSGSSLHLGSITIESDATSIVLPQLKIGTGANQVTLSGSGGALHAGGAGISFASLSGKPTTIAGYGITDAFDGAFSSLSGKPTTIAGYGITDALTLGTTATTALAGNTTFSFASLTGKPTTIAGYGITDAFNGAYSSLTGIPTTIAHKNADIDIGSNDFITTGKVLFANMYSALSDLPSATTYHGMFAHVHATGGAYFAHAGNWIELANKSYVDTQVTALVDSAPATLNTLNELAAALNDDANFATTITTSIATKAPAASPSFTGTPAAPTAPSGTNTTQIATTAFVQAAVTGAGSYNNASVDTHLNTSTASSGEVLSWNGSDYDWVAQSGGGGGGGASVTTSDAAPSSPSDGDLWYNTNAGGLFVYYQDANSAQWVEVVGKTGATGAAGADGGVTVSVSDAAPSSPSAGQLWWNSTANKLYIYYQDANSSQWVQATTPGATGAAGSAGAAGAAGSTGATGATGPAAGRNHIINGNFQIWQRGTSFTAVGYTCDRWRTYFQGGTGVTLSRQAFAVGHTDVPYYAGYYARAVVTSGNAAGSRAIFSQKIEGAATMAGQTVTISFYAKADATRNIAIEFLQYYGTGGSPSAYTTATPQKFALSTTWTKYTKTFTIPSISGKTLGTNNNDYIDVAFFLDAGSDFNSRSDSLGNQSGTFDFSQVQVELGSSATEYEGKTYGEVIEQCQRYYVEWDPTTNYAGIGIGRAWGSNNMNLTMYLPTRMRAQPSVSKTGSFDIVGISGGASGLHLDGWAYPNFLKLGVTGQNNFNTGANFFYQVEGTNNTSSRIHIDAEL